jgi:hypothetical protein
MILETGSEPGWSEFSKAKSRDSSLNPGIMAAEKHLCYGIIVAYILVSG